MQKAWIAGCQGIGFFSHWFLCLKILPLKKKWHQYDLRKNRPQDASGSRCLYYTALMAANY
jgi:hypothetical protein